MKELLLLYELMCYLLVGSTGVVNLLCESTRLSLPFNSLVLQCSNASKTEDGMANSINHDQIWV